MEPASTRLPCDASSELCIALHGLQVQASTIGPRLGSAVGTMPGMHPDNCRFVRSIQHGDLVLDVYILASNWRGKNFFKCTWRGVFTQGATDGYATTVAESDLRLVPCVFVRTAPSVCRQFDRELTNELAFGCPWSQLNDKHTALFGTIFDQVLSASPALANDDMTTSECLQLHDVLDALIYKSKEQKVEWVARWNALGLGDFSTNPSVVVDWDIDRILVFTAPNGREAIRAELTEVNKLWHNTLAQLQAIA